MPDDATPFALVVRFTVRPGSEQAFDRLTEETTSGIREREYGTLIYACHTVEGQPRQRIFYELYRNRAAFEEHEAQEHVRRFLDQRAALLESTEVDFLTLQDGKTPPRIPAGRHRRGHAEPHQRNGRTHTVCPRSWPGSVRWTPSGALVEGSDSPQAAESGVMELLDIDQVQARAVLDLQLRSLSPQRQQRISDEYEEALAEIADLESILASPDRLRELVGTERGRNLARYDERRWARTGDEDWPGPPLGGAAGTGA